MPTALRMERVLQALSRWAVTDLGARAAQSLQAAAAVDEANQRLDEVAEAVVLCLQRSALPLPQHLDVAPWLEQAMRGAVLEPVELATTGRLARATAQVKRAASQWPSEAPALRKWATEMADLELLGSLLADAIDDEGHILDSASPALARLRQEVVALAARLRRRIEALVKETDAAGLLQDEYYTLRDDRYVLPVVASAKRSLPGIIHGTSQTGQTVYVEPQELVEGNNQLALAYDAVRREEQRILAELSGLCAEQDGALRDAAARMAHLDLRMAAAHLALHLEAQRPLLGPADGELLAPRLRHPLLVLDGTAVVPSDLALKPPQRWLVVSGPNGGGKTVVLTALGLMAEMARHGLFVCAGSGCQVPWFDRVEVVLGDAQDLERGLSTFEGHLRWVASTLATAQRAGPSLLLFDELANGTEPAAGSALATAILEHAAATLPSAWGAVTTHFEGCKLLAVREPCFVNAALALDPRTLTPTYRLVLGQVGTSNPLALATRIGLPATVVDRAQQLLGTGGSEVAVLMERLVESRAALQAQTDAVEHEKRQLQHARTLLEDQRRNEQRAADRRIERTAAEALGELQSLARELDAARQAAASQDRDRIDQAAQLVSMRQVQAEQAQRAAEARLTGKTERPALDPALIQPGLVAWHRGLERAVEVVEAEARRDRFKVNAGGIELWCQAADLRQAIAADRASLPAGLRKPDRRPGRDTTVPPAQAKRASDATQQPQSLDESGAWMRSAAATVDVRGMRADEAVTSVDRHLDRAILSGEAGVCIIHGVGTGAVRDAVRAHLRGHPHAAQWRTGERHEGGDGVTLVWLKA